MTRNQETHRFGDSFITALAFGGFLVIVGAIFAFTPNLWQRTVDFFNSITMTSVPFGSSTSTIVLPAPAIPSAHSVLYTALLQFDIAFGFLQLLVLALRVWARSRVGRLAETVGNAIFWLGAAALVNVFLLTGTIAGWFEFWAALIVIVGVSFIARAVVYFVKK